MQEPLAWTIEIDEFDPETTLIRGMIQLISVFESHQPGDSTIDARDKTIRVLDYIRKRFPPIEEF